MCTATESLSTVERMCCTGISVCELSAQMSSLRCKRDVVGDPECTGLCSATWLHNDVMQSCWVVLCVCKHAAVSDRRKHPGWDDLACAAAAWVHCITAIALPHVTPQSVSEDRCGMPCKHLHLLPCAAVMDAVADVLEACWWCSGAACPHVTCHKNTLHKCTTRL